MTLAQWLTAGGAAVGVAGIVGTIATGGLLPIIAGGALAVTSIGAGLYESRQDTIAAQQKTLQAQLDLEKTKTLASATPQTQSILTGQTLSYTLEEYAPVILIGLAVLIGLVMFVRK